MAAKYLSVYRIKSVYNFAGALVVAEDFSEAVMLWCSQTDSRESAIGSVERLGDAITAK